MSRSKRFASSRWIWATVFRPAWLAALAASLMVPAFARAQPNTPLDAPAAKLWQSLRELSNTGSVLYVVAHPDDEDGALLAQLARGEGARTMLFSVTRGEGGANMISADFFDALGLLRTLEHQAAANFYGSEIFYSHAVDYGYSKQLDEALRSWEGVDPLLADLVRVIRRERPDVIAARFRGDSRDGHGHHQFSGVIAKQAFEAAADPQRFPEQLAAGLQPWQASKLYHDNLRDEERDADAAVQLATIDTGQKHPILDESYAQISRRGLRLQRSQGMGGVGLASGPSSTHYRLIDARGVDAAPRESSLLAGIDTSIAGIAKRPGVEVGPTTAATLTWVQNHVDEALDAFDPLQPEASAAPLLRGLKEAQTLREAQLEEHSAGARQSPFEAHLTRLIAELETAVAAALDLELHATCVDAGDQQSPSHVNPGHTIEVSVRVDRPASLPMDIADYRFSLRSSDARAAWRVEPAEQGASAEPSPSDSSASARFIVDLPTDAALTRPYWRRDSLAQSRYDLIESDLAGRPLPPPPLSARATLSIDGVAVRLRGPVEVVDNAGEAAQYPLHVLPRVSVALAPRRRVIPTDQSEFRVPVTLSSWSGGPVAGELRLESTTDLQFEPSQIDFHLPHAGAEFTAEFVVGRPEDASAGDAATAEIRAVARLDQRPHEDRQYDQSVRWITAPDLSRFPFYEPALLSVRWADLQLPDDLRVGYVRGTGDEVGSVLESLGVEVDYLDSDQLANADFDPFDAVVIGVRAYAVRDDLIDNNQRLLQYVRNGGVAVVQYQTPEFDKNFGPYRYVMGRRPEEVSEEDSPIKILEPEHPVLVQPNAIGLDDFEGWIEQRGSKFLAEWDDRYVPLLETRDQGQLGQRGGLLYARYGEGAYIYAAYAWYRQLPQGVPGAHRLFANLISHRRYLSAE